MQQYEVYVEERVLMRYCVDADSEEEAKRKAIDFEDVDDVDVAETLDVYKETMYVCT